MLRLDTEGIQRTIAKAAHVLITETQTGTKRRTYVGYKRIGNNGKWKGAFGVLYDRESIHRATTLSSQTSSETTMPRTPGASPPCRVRNHDHVSSAGESAALKGEGRQWFIGRLGVRLFEGSTIQHAPHRIRLLQCVGRTECHVEEEDVRDNFIVNFEN